MLNSLLKGIRKNFEKKYPGEDDMHRALNESMIEALADEINLNAEKSTAMKCAMEGVGQPTPSSLPEGWINRPKVGGHTYPIGESHGECGGVIPPNMMGKF